MQISSSRHRAVGPKSHSSCPPQAQNAEALPKVDEFVPPWDDPRPWIEFQRPSRLLSAKGNIQTVSNVRWGFSEVGEPSDWPSRFADTTLNLEKVKDIHLGLEEFNGMGHTFLVVEFEEDSPLRAPNGETDNRLVLSIEAWRKEGQSWEIPKAFGREYAILYQLSTFGDYAQGLSRKFLDPMRLHKMNLSPEEAKKVAKAVLTESVKDRTGDYYHATADSCYARLMDVINRGLDDERQVDMKILGVQRPTTMWPALAPVVLQRSGLLAPESSQSFPTDPEMGPQKGTLGTLGKATGAISRTGLLTPTLSIAGAAVGAYAGSLALPGMGSVVGLVSGFLAGEFLGQQLQVRYDTKEVDPRPYYPRPPE